MQYKPRHPDEPALHEELRKALNEDLTDKGFFVWIDVEPTGDARHFENLDQIVRKTDEWLHSLDPDAVQEGALPEIKFEDPAAVVEITAIPRKKKVRGYRAQEIVGNAGPMLIGWG